MMPDLLENKQIDFEDYRFYQNLNKNNLQVYSIILGIFICYYLRFKDSNERKELAIKLSYIIKKFNNSYKDFLFLPNKEELFILNNIELEKSIAKNRALLDNVFSLFTAINNKVPIFIVGKSGCSKSLSVQLIKKSMKGSLTNNILFKNYPKIISNLYQGSISSTSRGLENVFKKARRQLKAFSLEDKKNYISMIIFEDIGLTENSPNNPLQMIFSEIEYDFNLGDKKVAFVGTSNCALDKSLINRGILLSIPEINEDDIKFTANTIGESYKKILPKKNKNIYENLGSTYYTYKKFLKIDHHYDGKEEFHGNIDFYHFVKNVASNMAKINSKQIDNHIIDNISLASIERNFGGLQFKNIKMKTSIQKMKSIYNNKFYEKDQIIQKYDVLDRIKENINNLESRYLLLISNSSISLSLLESILSQLNKEYIYYIGSRFENDLHSEEYALKVLNKIQLYIKQGKLLILKNFESVYPALYDLFNKNFIEINKEKYALISIGSKSAFILLMIISYV